MTLRVVAEHLEGPVGRDPVQGHQDALRLLDDPRHPIQAYDVFADATASHALKVVLHGTPVDAPDPAGALVSAA